MYTVLDFVKTSYTIGENRLLIPICVAIVSGVNFVINGTIRTSSNTATGMININFNVISP